jgi:hypothetical protein
VSTFAAPVRLAADRAGPGTEPRATDRRQAESRGLRPSRVPVGTADRVEGPSRRPPIQRCGINSTARCPAHEQVEGVQRDLGGATATGGAPLPPAARERMERAFSFDFGAVRVHTGGKASDASAALDARAVTTGADILFGAGEYAPGTARGDRLLAHELAHVVQQSQGLPRQPIDGGPADRLEVAARAAAERAAPVAQRRSGGAEGLAGDRATPAAEREADGAARIAATGGSVPRLSRQPRTIARQPAGGGAPPPAPTVPVTKNAVPVQVRVNALDFVNNVQAKFGDEGGHTIVSGDASWTSVDGKIDTVSSTWAVKEEYPSVMQAPGASITATELAACRSLASRIEQHEDSHAATEKARREKFLPTLKGTKDADAGKKIDELECEIGQLQRGLDCREGKITLDGSNQLQVSAVDHPEYVATTCAAKFKTGGCAAPAAPAKKP